MRSLSKKLLTVLLMLLLGFLPLQNAIADIATSSDQGESVHQMKCMHDAEMVMVADQSSNDCDQCNTEPGCADCTAHACSSGHCASSVLAVLSAFSYPESHTVISKFLLVADNVIGKSPSSLFRPPRV